MVIVNSVLLVGQQLRCNLAAFVEIERPILQDNGHGAAIDCSLFRSDIPQTDSLQAKAAYRFGRDPVLQPLARV